MHTFVSTEFRNQTTKGWPLKTMLSNILNSFYCEQKLRSKSINISFLTDRL